MSKSSALQPSLIGLAASGSFATINTRQTGSAKSVQANVGGVDLDAGTLEVDALSLIAAKANVEGITVASTAAVGVSEANIRTGAQVGMEIGNSLGSINVGTLDATAGSDGNPAGSRMADATAKASGGGLLIGINSTSVLVSNTDDVAATVGNGADITAGTFVMDAYSNVKQLANSKAASVGLVGVGAAASRAESNTSVTSIIGVGADITAGAMTVTANGTTDNDAKTETGAFGLVGAAAASPETSTTAVVKAGLADGTSTANRAELDVSGLLRMTAAQLSNVDTEVVTESYGAIAGAGAVATNTITSTVDVEFGTFAKASAGEMDLQATNKLVRTAGDNDIDGKTGGIASGASAKSDTRAEMHTTITFGNDSDIDTTDPQGDLLAKAFNEIAYADKVRLETAGALSGAGAYVTFNERESGVSVPIKADIIVGNRADIEARGELEFEASGKFDVYLQSYSETYGAATVALGSAIIDIQPENTIRIKSNAEVLSHRDMFMSTGTDRNLTIEDSNLEARVDNFAGSVIPIDDLRTQAIYLARNVIVVEANALVESFLNIDLNADELGLASVIGMAKGTNWASAVADGINSLTGGTDNSTGPGEGLSDARSQIINNGLIKTGARRDLELSIGEVRDANDNLLGYTYNGTLDPDFVGDVNDQFNPDRLIIKTSEKTSVIPSSGQIALTNAYNNLATYGVFTSPGVPDLSNNFTKSYVDTIARIEAQMIASGEGFRDAADNFGTIERTNRVIVIDDIVAAAGRIRILTDQLTGTGTFDAPQDVKVEITSDSTASIEFGEIYIPQRNGGVDFNGITVTSFDDVADIRAAILAENQVSVAKDNRPLDVIDDLQFLGFVSTLSPNSLQFSPETVGSGPGAAPEITIQIDKNVREVPFQAGTLPTGDQVVTFKGEVFAPTANLSIFGPRGPNEVSVLIEADVNVANQTVIVGGTIQIGVKGDIHTNGDPYGKYINSGIIGDTPLTAGTENAKTPQGSTVEQITADLIRRQNLINELGGPQTGSSATYIDDTTGELVRQGLQANTIILRGGFVNVNGLIQAGQSEFSLTLTDYVRNQLLNTNGVRTIDLGNDDFFGRYDSGLNRLTIVGMNPKGGLVDIEGRIVATSQGKIVSHAGYPHITIDNQMNLEGLAIEGLDLVIESMDVSLKGEGTIILKDKTRGVRDDDSDLAMYYTEYKSDANGNVTTTDGLIDPVTWDASRAMGALGTVNANATHSGGNASGSVGGEIVAKRGYSTADGFRYGWVVGQGARTEIIQEKTYNSLWGLDFLLADVTNIPVVDTTILSTSLVPNSNYFYFDNSTNADYTYDSDRQATLGTPERTAYKTTTSWYGKKSTFVQFTTIETSFTKHNHTIAADKTIDIEFTGFNNSSLNVNAGQANLIIAGKITNENGTTTLSSQGTITTEKVAAQGLAPTVGGTTINITGLAGVGVRDYGVIRPTDAQPYTAGDSRALNALQLSQTAGGTLNVTSNSDILLQQKTGDLSIGSIRSFGDGLVEILTGDRDEGAIGANGGSILNAAGGSYVQGGSIRLDADGAIGGATAITIDTGTRTNDVLTALATDDINLFQNTNDLRVFQIASSSGDVTVTMTGDNDLIDANQIQEADTRSREALLGGVWGDMELLGDVTAAGSTESPAELKILEAIERLNSARVEDYRTYWDWRNLHNDTELAAVIAGDRLVKISEDDNTDGLKASIVAQLVAGGANQADAEAAADSQIITLQQARTAQFLEQNARYGTETSENLDPALDLTSADEKQAIRDSIKVWTQDELLNAIGSGLLKPVTDTTVNIEDPNIIGARVAIDIEGKVGRTEGDVTILVSDGRTLTEEEQLIIAAAERSDLFFLVSEIDTVNVTFSQADNAMIRSSGSWTDGTGPEFRVGQTVQIQGNTPNATEDERYYVISGFSGDGRTMFFEDTGTTFAKSVLTVALTTPVPAQVNVSAIVNDPSGASVPVIADVSGNTITWTGGDYDFLGAAQGAFDDIQGFREGDLILLSTTRAYTPAETAAQVATTNANDNLSLFRISAVTATSMTLTDKDGNAVSLNAETGVTLTVDEFVELVGVQVLQREDFDIESSENLNIASVGETFVGTENQILLGTITVADAADGSDGQLRLKSGNGILNNIGSTATNIIADSIVLEGGDGSIGRLATDTLAENRIYMNLSEGSIVTARTQGEVVLAERDGDFLVGTLYSASSDVDVKALA
ncbi:hypothetical protein QTO30_13520 [Yoonia sp. GPGPB17]|uniref:hypothetical protein n=1 Tax=Yoonia sp. GPGPB17 TaxID=3026147 RepID=UPI0030C4B47C